MTDYAIAMQLYYSGGYHTISASRIAAAGVTYTRGVSDEWDLLKGSCNCRIIDDDDTYRPSNPASALYDIVGAFLPMRYQLDGVNRFAGEVESLEPGQTDDHQTAGGVTTRGVRWVDFKATGPLGTLGRWRDLIASPLYTQIQSLTTMRGYWSGEDGTDATVMSGSTSNTSYATTTAVTFGGADGPAGSNKLLTIGAGGRVDGRFPTNVSTSGWQIQFTSDVKAADATERLVFAWTTSNGYGWQWKASLTTYNITVVDDSGTTIYNSSIGNGGVTPGENIVFRLKASLSGGTWTFEPGWYGENDPVLTGSSGTFSGTAGRPVTWLAKENTVMNGAYLGHVFITDGVTESLQSYEMLSAINGYPGETTCDRATRILAGRGIPFEILGDTTLATKMGAQRPGTVKQQLQEIQRTEQGLFFESPDGRGLRLALRRYLYQQANAPVLELTYPDDIGPGFTELNANQDLYNTVIAQDRSGVSATAQETTGRYGTADPPTGAGLLDKTWPCNMLELGNVAQLANSMLRYFQQVQRFGPIVVDLDANPSLRTAVEAADVGMFIRLSGKTPDPFVLMIVRVGAKDQLKRHVVTFETLPGEILSTGQWDGDRKYSLATCTLTNAETSTSTAWEMTITGNESWGTNTPYDIEAAGERVTVTAVGARTGTLGAYAQTLTVTRSANGVVKAQTAGTQVKIARAQRGHWGW